MLFNSIEFAIFLPLVFFSYWYLCGHSWRIQNCLLLAASLVFYGWWDPRFLTLILASSLIDFGVGNAIFRTKSVFLRRAFLSVSIVLNFGMLALFKYYNFFVDSLSDALQLWGMESFAPRLDLVLPVGISFYTFQTVSSSIDVYRGTLKPTSNVIAYLTFVTFFPQLVAGPIERAGHLLPQFLQERHFDSRIAIDGLRQALWGLFKKIVIADNCAALASQTFGNVDAYSGFSLFLGAFLFAIQIYCDFSGYSDIAVGAASLFGFSLMQNFAFPYFSRDIAEFWRRWHISLSTWFRDYVYMPLGGSRCSRPKMIRNTMVVFLMSGLWHGANWTFLAWGLLNALYFLPLQLAGKNRRLSTAADDCRMIPSLLQIRQIGITFLLTVLAWIFFRAASLSQALLYLQRIFTFSAGESLVISGELWALVFGFLVVEWCQRSKKHALDFEGLDSPRWVRWSCYYGILVFIVFYGGDQQDFIYFQF